jgi:hypothetical protein
MKRRRISIGMFGALLPLPLVSGGSLLARHVDFARSSFRQCCRSFFLS